MQRILIDTDPGLDDAIAILLALNSPELQVEAITTVSGNVHVELATQNVLTILGLLDLHKFPIIAKGSAAPLVKPLETATYVHGEDGLGNTGQLRNTDGSLRYAPADTEISSRPGVDTVLEMAACYPDELVIVALGPLTNIAHAFRKDSARMRRVRRIVVMGGAFEVYGNVTTTAEFNIFVDPHAAQEVFQSKVPIDIVPLDATQQVALTGERLHAEIAGRDDKVSLFLKESTKACMEFYREHRGFHGFYIHDALPIGMLTHPGYFQNVATYVQVETESNLTNGMTVADLRDGHSVEQPNAAVCKHVSSAAFLAHLFTRLLG